LASSMKKMARNPGRYGTGGKKPETYLRLRDGKKKKGVSGGAPRVVSIQGEQSKERSLLLEGGKG